MVWSYSEISLEDLTKLIKNFIDMLILASGYQSTGRLAHWDSRNIKKCFQWALFLENVSKDLTSSVDYQESVKVLDDALHELTTNIYFPQGLHPLSCVTLGRAKDLLLEHLIHALPMRELHLKAIMTASVEMDFRKLKGIESDCLDVYLEKLAMIPSEGQDLNMSRNLMEVSNVAPPDAVRTGKDGDWVDSDFSVSAFQQLGRRQMVVSGVSAVETGLECIWKSIGQSMHGELGNMSNSEPVKHMACLIAEEMPVESMVWDTWRLRSLSYMLDKRTIRLVSGANLICSAPDGKWTQVFERLNMSSEAADLSETLELLLLGCVADRWSVVVEHLMSVTYQSLTISRLYQEVFNLPLGSSFNFFLKKSLINSKEKSIIDYLEVLLSNQLNQLWGLSSVLAAVAIPSWSRLFRSYLSELEGQFRGNSLAIRRCSCIGDAVEHRD
ncbi:hypothetical protein OROGR_019506 [Orobanche gracilis]